MRKETQQLPRGDARLSELLASYYQCPVIPASIFSGKRTPLQALSAYLQETSNLSAKDISQKIDVSHATIINALKGAANKDAAPIDHSFVIPLSAFSTNDSPRSVIANFLSEKYNLSFTQIARLLNRDPSNVRKLIVGGEHDA